MAGSFRLTPRAAQTLIAHDVKDRRKQRRREVERSHHRFRAATRPEELFFQIRKGERPRQKAHACNNRSQSWPQCFVVRLSDRCNLACTYCFDASNSARRQDMDLTTARQIADYILRVPGSKPVISFFGGEPLVNWKAGRFLLETLRREGRAKGKDPYFNIITNGTLITPELAAELVADDITVQISIDGSRQDHDRYRRYPNGAGSHQATLGGLELLRAASPESQSGCASRAYARQREPDRDCGKPEGSGISPHQVSSPQQQ